ncbi:MAG: hypothetical protein CMM01_06880 [Rhodopirellula sp.]|nr:hypothetical protein [Rhodopirellula sp.]OUX51907.1 MAG: hypothetical protein CBE43_02230 [Rhodopirellula sp. TMED283]
MSLLEQEHRKVLAEEDLLTAAKADPVAAQREIAAVLRDRCVHCHGEAGEVRGEVDLVDFLKRPSEESEPELLQDLIRVVDLGEMPPEDEGELAPAVQAKLVKALRTRFERLVAEESEPELAEIRRMNRFQYNNAVKDLFRLKSIVFTLPERMMRQHSKYFDPASGKMPDTVRVGSRPLGKSQMIEKRLAGVAAFPQDLRAEHGFDNRGDQLSLSPLLMEAFLSLSQSIVGSPDFTPANVGIWKEFFAEPTASVSQPDEARIRLKPFLTRAFRRPVSENSLTRYADYAKRQLESGVGFTEVMKRVSSAVLASPRFLYLYSTPGASDSVSGDPASDAKQPDLDAVTCQEDIDLASRLSFFLWGSIPDQELIELASTGQLRDPDVLQGQFRRLMQDPKLKRFCDSFPSQWLQLERIISSVPNREKFPGFYMSKYRHSMHMMLEPLLLFEAVLIENMSLTQLIDSDFTYRSPLLQRVYGGVEGNKNGGGVTALNFTRQPVNDRRQGGVITNPATLTMTSGTDRTKPITRGAWVSSVIFNLPPEPPPADVPPLEEQPLGDEKNLTLRERLALHRERADCAGCHEKIDPLGFALENFDAIGKWRKLYENGREIDSSGKLFRRHEFSDIAGFKDAILAEKDRFVRGFAGHLLSFALARELGPRDQSELDRIAAATIDDGYRIQTLFREVVFSKPFLCGVELSDQSLTTSP